MLLLLSRATKRNNCRFKESRNSDETLSLSRKPPSGSSATCGAVGEDLCPVPGWSLLTEELGSVPKCSHFLYTGVVVHGMSQ